MRIGLGGISGTNILSIGRGVSVGGGGVPLPEVEFLLRDDFLTDENPLASPRDAEPGPGTLIDVLGGSYIENQRLWSANFRYNNAFRRRTGLTIVSNGYGSGGRGWDNDLGSSLVLLSVSTHPTGGLYIGSTTNGVFARLPNDFVWLAQVMRSDGSAFLLVKDATMYPVWTLAYVTWPYWSNPNIDGYPGVYGGAHVSTFRVLDMGDVWQDDFGIATQRLSGAQSAGTTFAHEPNCIVEWRQTAMPSDGYTDVYFRCLDDDNCLVLSVASDGTIELHEISSGAWTSLGSSSPGVVANGYRVAVSVYGDDIRVISEDTDGTNDVRFITSDPGAFATRTIGKIAALGTGGAVSDLITWPRRLSGLARRWLDAAIAN